MADRRTYVPGESETITNEDVGTPTINIWYYFELDGLFKFELADIVLKQSGVPVPGNAYELAEATDYTAKEVGKSGKKIYAMFRITNASYAGNATTVDGLNFGAMTDNDIVKGNYDRSMSSSGSLVVLDDADYAYTIESTDFNITFDCSNFTADRTITFTQGAGANILNKITILNPSAYRAILTDSTDTYWCQTSESFNVFFNQNTFSRSTGWGLVYDNSANTLPVPATSLLGGAVFLNTRYSLLGSYVSDGRSFLGEVYIKEISSSVQVNGISGAERMYYSTVAGFNTDNSSVDIKQIWRWYNGY